MGKLQRNTSLVIAFSWSRGRGCNCVMIIMMASNSVTKNFVIQAATLSGVLMEEKPGQPKLPYRENDSHISIDRINTSEDMNYPALDPNHHS